MKADFLKGMDAEIEDPWKPIETAPKDGTDVLVWDGSEIFLVWWDSKAEGGDGIWVRGDHSMHRPVTHWMALPQPPKTDKL